MVEIALGPNGSFENGNIDTLRRRAPPDQLLSAVLPSRGNPKPPREPKTPRVVELLRKAIEWKSLLEAGKVISQADIACQEGITRARVTQVMGLLRLAPEIQEKILALPCSLHRRPVTERLLRPIGAIPDQRDQVREFNRFLGLGVPPRFHRAEGGTRTTTGFPREQNQMRPRRIPAIMAVPPFAAPRSFGPYRTGFYRAGSSYRTPR